MSEAPYIPFYTSDFLGGTSGMTAASKGVYITLLCLMYETEAPLRQSWDVLARRCGCTLPAFRRAVESLEDDGKITVTDAGVWSEKCERHIAQRRERQSSAKAAAKKRWQKNKEKQGKSDTGASSAQCQPEPEPYEEANASSKSTRVQVRDALEQEASAEAVASFIAYRSKTKAKALTVTAAKRLAASLRAIIDGGGCADDALGLAEERGWQTVKPDWYFRETRNDNRTQHNLAATGTDSADRVIAFAARAVRAPSRDCF